MLAHESPIDRSRKKKVVVIIDWFALTLISSDAIKTKFISVLDMSNRGRGRGRGGGAKPTDRSSSPSSANSSRSSSLTTPASSTTTTPDAERLMKQYQNKISVAAAAVGTARPTIRVAPKIPVPKKEKDKPDSASTAPTTSANNELSSTNTRGTFNGNRPQNSRGGRNSNYRDSRLNYVQTTSIFESSAQIPVSSAPSSSYSNRTAAIKREATESSTKTLNLKKLGPKKTILIGDVDGLKYEIDEEYEPRQIPIADRKSVFDPKKEPDTIQKKKDAAATVNSDHINSFVQLFAQQKLNPSASTTVKLEAVEPTDLPKPQEPISDPSQLILMQFPDVLPCTRTSSSSSKPELASLSQLPDGFLGKLQIYKSGKCRLKLNDDTYLDVDIGHPTSFLQNVMVTEMASASSASSEPGTNNDMNKLVCLGDIKHKLIVSLDVDHVLQDTRQ